MDRGAWRATAHGVRRVGHNLVTIPASPPKGSTGMLVPYHHYSWWKKRGSLHIISHSEYFSPTSSQMRRRPFTTIMYWCFFFFFFKQEGMDSNRESCWSRGTSSEQCKGPLFSRSQESFLLVLATWRQQILPSLTTTNDRRRGPGHGGGSGGKGVTEERKRGTEGWKPSRY